MGHYIIRRILRMIPTLFLAVTLIFIAARVLPGDPAEALLGQYMSAEALKTVRHQLGLDLPVWQQYANFWKDLFHGNLGTSFALSRPNIELIADVMPFTAIVVLGGLTIGTVIGIPLGILSAVKRNTWLDYIARVVSLLGLSLPGFVIGILLMLPLAVMLGWFPLVGGGSLSDPKSLLHFAVLPSLAGGLGMASYLTRISRSAVLEVLNEDYIRTARAKGVSIMKTLFKHVLRNALIPIVTFIGIYAVVMVGDSITIEVAFSRPGFGRLIFGAITQRDYSLLQAILLLYVAFSALVNLLVDLLYAFIDPRIKYS